MRLKLVIIAFGILNFTKLLAQFNFPLNSSEIFLELQKLNTVGSVLYIAAHPDDENTRLLAYLSKEKKVRTAYLSLTRGDGGQNLIGGEQGEALGLIRTQELLAARKIDGAEQFFTRAFDFGYSKNPYETFSHWNKDSILHDVVYVIRKFKPDIIICRFPTTGEGGHGHHTASALLALEAFEAAANPNKFSEQLKLVDVWKSRKIFWNTFNFDGVNTTSEEQVKIDVGLYNALLGKNYGEIASESRSMHKSQGFATAKQRGSSFEHFKQLKGDSTKIDLFDNITISWERFPENQKIKELINECITKYDFNNPEKSLPLLSSIYSQLKLIKEENSELRLWKYQKLKETENLLQACAGLWIEALCSEQTTCPGAIIITSLQAICRNKSEVIINKVRFTDNTDTILNMPLKPNNLIIISQKTSISSNAPYSNPHWLNKKRSANFYILENDSTIGFAENPKTLSVELDLSIAGQNIKITRPLLYKQLDPVKGELYRKLEIMPPVTINLPEKVFVFENNQAKKIQLKIKSHTNNIEGKIEVKVTNGWTIKSRDLTFKLTNKGNELIREVEIAPNESGLQEGTLAISVNIDRRIFNNSLKRMEYDHIPPQFILSNTESKLLSINLHKKALTIGYIPGAGDEIIPCLKQIGYNAEIINENFLTRGDLSEFSTIIMGVRAYNTNEKLHSYYDKLMNYVKQGGNLIVQYNTNNSLGAMQANIGPYPFVITRERVTNEKSEVRLLNVKHPVFNFPNKISLKDFEGWIQEMGIYFAGEIDKQYDTLISMADPGEKENNGSLIIGKYGKGNFVYTGLSFFRQLPAGVSGAYSLFVNLISLPKN